MKLNLSILCLLLISASPCLADDFFMEGEKAEQATEEENSFTILNAFEGEKSEEEKAEERRKKELPWREFEDVSGTDVEKSYYKSDEVRLRKELNKPLPSRRPFGNRLDSLEDSVNNLRTPSVIDTLRK